MALVLAVLALLLWLGGSTLPYDWQWARAFGFVLRWQDGTPVPGPLLIGLGQTLRIAALAGVIALVIALITAILRLSNSISGRWLARAYVEVIRNTPLIVQISMFYFAIAPLLGIERFWAGVLALALFEAAFLSEIIRAGILGVALTQWEAAASLGLTRPQTYRLIVLPQALRAMLPPLTSSAVALVMDSSIVSVIALAELTTAGRNAIADNFLSFEIWFLVAGLYLTITLTLSAFARRLERRYVSTSGPARGARIRTIS
ncbi:amino acid ABC transporter permease [Rhodobacter ferrooxidans]|uniref:Polar amino acid ABC transporter, inner membrane subunit n=1 Tax=Rhodobacter ferrooxidans TaxID=371731 RepID=C8RZY7_9RHOB|nr:amino acid ABC transporter permease [Rhodobacter sp. SW2]EEW25596.1 polar amino acid ABC transporter, inner membrane subunit [Rhodobacter sp. SW2]